MAKSFQTIFTNLTDKFSGSAGRAGQPAPSGDVQPRSREVISASSREELDAKKLQIQQNRYLHSQFLRMVSADGDKKIMYESNRMSQYIDYQRMEYYPIISAALDLLAEESTTVGQDGKMLKVYSSNKRVKAELENLFTNTLDLNTILQFWARNLPVKHDSMIPLLDGTQLTIKELSEQIRKQPEKEFWTYSVQDGTQNIVPGKIVWCGLTRKDETIYRVNLDDNSYIETSGDHEYLLRKGGVKRAMDLLPGDSLMPFYTKISNVKEKDIIAHNHKVLSVEIMADKHDVYCMEVQGPNGEHDRHNFPVCGRKLDGTYTLNGSFVANCKYGDNFVFMLLDEKRGVIGAKQLTNVEVERVEEIVEDKLVVKFKYKNGGVEDEYTTWQVAHFRLLGDDRRMPYGMSVLDKVRRTFKMLTLFEDSMMVYRITRAAERRIFKVDVGDMPEEDVDQFVEQVARSTKSTKLVDDVTGDFNWKYNVATNDSDYFIPVRNGNAGNPIETLPGACLSLDTKIPLLDGRTLELNEIISEYAAGKKLWVYSINPATGEVVPGPITWAGVTRTDTQVLKITLDNGEEIISTTDHKFPTRTGIIKKAEDLAIGESLYSFQETTQKVNSSNNEYHMIYDHAKQKYVYSHRMVAQYFPKNELIFDESTLESPKETIHHADFNRWNNNPENLVYMNSNDHMRLHQTVVSDKASVAWKNKFHSDEDFKNSIIDRLAKIRTEYYETRTPEQAIIHNQNLKAGIINHFANMTDEQREKNRIKCQKNVAKATIVLQEKLRTEPEFKKEFYLKSAKGQKQTKATDAWKAANKRPNYIYSQELLKIVVDYARNGYTNQKELAKLLSSKESQFMTIFHELNNNNPFIKIGFKGFSENIFRRMLKSFGYSGLRDLRDKLPMYNHRIINIEYLADTRDTGTITVDGNEEFHNFHNFALASGVFTQNSNLSEIGDISYLRDNLFTGLGIPKAFLGFSDGSGGEGKSLSMLDIRFARKVNKIQQSLVSELNKIAMIHLYILGGDYREHLDDFTLTLANPSTQSEILKIETLKAKFDTFEQATRIGDNGTKAWSEIRAKREILGMSDEEIMDDLQEQMIEAKIGDEIKASGQLIRSSGLFDKLIKYKNAGFLNQPTAPGGEGGPEGGGGADPMADLGGGADPMADLAGGDGNAGPPPDAGDPLAANPMNERMGKGKKLARGLNTILSESQMSKELNSLVNGKESRLISENINIENSLNQLIDDLESNN